MSRDYTYVIYRHGSNAFNQSMTNVMPIAVWTIPRPLSRIEDWYERFMKEHPSVNIYNNQYLTAKPFSCVSKADVQLAQEEMEMAQKFIDSLSYKNEEN